MIRSNYKLLPEATYVLDELLTPFAEELQDSFLSAPGPSEATQAEKDYWKAKADATTAAINLQERFPHLFTRRYVYPGCSNRSS
jgi:hypothetical protein